MRKNVLMILLVIGLLLTLFSIGVFADSHVETHYIKIGLTVPEDHPYADGLKYYFKELNDRTVDMGHKFELDLYPSNQLGGERDLVEGVQMGTLKMSLTSAGPLSAFNESIKVLDLPFVFENSEHAYRVLDGSIGEEILEGFSDKGLIGLAYFESGWRHLTNNVRPVYSPEDLEGLKIRVMESEVMIKTLNAMGAQATPMGWPEVLTALQQGTIDGQENPLVVIWGQGVYDVQEHLSLTGHFYTSAPLLVNKTFFESLPGEVQTAMRETADVAKDYQRELVQKKDQESLENIKESGMEVVPQEEVNIEAFRESVQPIYEMFADEVGGMEYIEKIMNY